VPSPASECVCGHEREVHEHFRGGSDCGVCGPTVCAGFRASTWWRRVLRRS